jgi:two-component system, cell cycle sensor histidine kinase and response regulator CckA
MTDENLLREIEILRRRVAELEDIQLRLTESERALSESEGRFRLLYENAPLAYQSLDEQGNFLEVNRAWLDSLGYARDEVIGKWCGDFLAPAYREKLGVYFPQFKAAGEIHGIEFEMARKDGSTILVSADGRIGRDSRGQFKQTHCILHDITERKRAEERLRLLDFAVDHVSEAAFLTDENAQFRFVNEEACRMLGYTGPELLGLGVSDIDPDFPMDRWPGHWNKLKTQGSLVFESRHKTRDGSIFPVEVNANYFEYRGRGYNLALIRDITERKQAEQERLANLGFFESMDRVNRAIQGANDLTQMMSDVLDIVLSIFDCDRAWLFYPCDPDAPYFRVPMEVAKPEYPGAATVAGDLPMPRDMARNLRETLESVGPVTYVAGTERPVNEVSADQFRVKSMMMTALYPKLDKPWAFGLHQCSYPRVWTSQEERLFQVIGRRLTDALTSLLMQSNLQESEIRYREIFENTSDVITVSEVTGDGRITCLDCNPAWEEAYGIDRSAVVGRFHERLPETAEPDRKVLEQYLACLRNRAPIDFEHECKSGSGVLYFHSTLIPVRDAAGSIYRLIGVGHNITGRKLAEEAAQQANQEWERTFNAISDIITVLDDRHRILRANRAAADALGMAQQDVIGRYCYELFHGMKEPPPSCPHTQLLVDGAVHSTELAEPHLGGIYDVRVSPLYGQDGQVIGSVHVTRDITENKRAEEVLYEAQQLFRTLVENSPDIIARYDRECRRTYVNPMYLKVAKIDPQELLAGSPIQRSPLPPESAAVLQDLLRRVLDRGAAEAIDVVWPKENNIDHWYNIYAVPEFDREGRVVSVMTVSRDITERKQAEEHLKRMIERFSLAANAARLGVWDWDIQGNDLLWDDGMYALYGIRREEFAGAYEAWLKGVHPDDRERCDEISRLARLGEGEYDTEFRVVWPDGSIHHLKADGQIVRDADGKPLRMTGINFDITERKQAEIALQKTNDLLRAIIEAAPTAIAALDLDGNVQSIWNPAAERMFGWSASEVMGRLLPSVPAESQEEFRRFRERIRSGKTLDGVEVRRQRRDGTPIDYSIYASPLHDADGLVSGNVCVLVDITERKRTEGLLRQSEEKYRTLFEESIDGVYSVLRNGEIRDANASFCQLFGYAREEMIGKDIRELHVEPADYPRFQKAIEKKGFVKDYEVTLRKKDGTAVDCLLSSSTRLGEDGSITEYRGILRDLTLRKALQRQLLQAQKMESIGTLAGGIAHDFNNLLQVIIGYSDMLLFKKNSSDPAYEGLRAIHQAGKDGAELAKRILSFSRRLEPDARPVNLNNEIRRVKKMLERTVPKMIRIEILLADNLMVVNADASQMEQVLLNLVVNAHHAMPDGGRLTIETANVTLDEEYSRTHLDVEPGDYVLLTVSDTGHGMDRQVMEHIFEPFYTTKGPGEGTGLGLAMVFGIVKSHKGHIICYSEPGTGTAFKIYLPAIAHEIEYEDSAIRQMPGGGTETVLLVDDEQSVRKLGEEMLRMAGYKVFLATNGLEALEVYRSNRNRIALVLLDLMMPEMGGKRCLEELLKIDPKAKVVIASGYSANGPTKDAMEGGAKGFVNKPYGMRQMLEVVRRVLDAE